MRYIPSLTILLSLSLLFGTCLQLVQTAAARPCDTFQLYDDAAASEILATERPFAPANRGLFFSWERDDWADAAPILDPQGPARTEQDTYQDLRAFLELRFPCSPRRVHDGLAVYINPIARQKIPDPTLRAALAALTGTLGEPAIRYLLYEAPVATIHFGVVVTYGEGWPQGTPAEVYNSSDGRYQIVFDGHYRFNPFETFSALLFHESLHVDRPPTGAPGEKPDAAGLPEEAAATSLEALVYMQMLLTDPALARLPDGLTRSGSNYAALIRLNSGVVGTDRLNLFVPDSDLDIDPLAAEPLTEFYEYYGLSDDPEWNERETRGTPLLATVLQALAEPGHTPPSEPEFDRATLEFIDQNHAIFSPGELIAVACILELDVPCP
jgi:hypothetical protein